MTEMLFKSGKADLVLAVGVEGGPAHSGVGVRVRVRAPCSACLRGM